jgi:hypothetical protein
VILFDSIDTLILSFRLPKIFCVCWRNHDPIFLKKGGGKKQRVFIKVTIEKTSKLNFKNCICV